MAFDHDLEQPVLINSTHQFSRQGLDNPDALYWSAYLDGDAEYVVRGRRGTTADLSFQVMGGSYSASSAPASLAAFDDRELDVAPDGTFEWRFGPLPGAKNLIIREVFNDWDDRGAGPALDRAHRHARRRPATPPGRDRLAKKYEIAGKLLVGSIQTWFAFPHFFQYQEPVNTLTPPRSTPGGLESQRSSIGHYELADDEALVVTVPECTDCSYQAIQIGSDWYASTDYETHQTSLTKAQSVVDPDGRMRYVISEAEPRDRQLAGDHRPPDRPDHAALAAARARPRPRGRADGREGRAGRRTRRAAALLPRHPRGVRRADRRPAALRGPKDAVVTFLLAGQGGRALRRRPRPRPLRSARRRPRWAPTSCWSAAPSAGSRRWPRSCGRTAGGRSSYRPTSPTRTPARGWSRRRWTEFGRVDCLINNAFGIPPMDPLTTLDLQSLRDANETNVFAPLRLSALFADALAASPNGSVIMLNSCVVYSSQPEYSGYKLSKGALAHLASSLATELGPRGIRVNSVAPSYIYEDVNKAYFDWLASEQGVTHEDVYREKAEPTDLKRLATPDEVAQAALFLGVRPGQRGDRDRAQRRLRRVPRQLT